MVGLGTIIEGKNAVLSVIESGRATSIGYLDNERLSEDIQNILNLAVQNKIELNTIIKELFTLIILMVIFKSSSLIWGFTIYFIIWHSIPSLLEQIKFAYGDLKRVHIMEYTKAALPYWIVSLAGMSLLYLVLKGEKHFYSLFFAFIAAVTFPHAIVMLKMFSKKNN